MAQVLLLADDSPGQAGTVLDHVAAFARWSRHEFFVFNPKRRGDTRRLDLGEFDAVIVHYSLLVTSDEAIPPRLREKIRRFGGLKVQYVQDDYRTVDAIAAAARDLGVGVLFCLVPEDQIESVWSAARLPGVLCRTTLAGYVPEDLAGRPAPPLRDRPLDVGYRSREVPFWLGVVAREKVRIAREFLEHAAPLGLRCDVAWAEESRIYGDAWFRFLSRCRSVLGSESAVSIFDFDGRIETRCREYTERHPGAGFEEVHRAVLAEHEGNVVIRVVSPRIFEAAAVRTPLVLFPGRYSGAVEPWRHYVPLQPDFSNFDEVGRRLRDLPFLEAMAARTEQDLVLSGRYSQRQMVREFDETVEGLLGTARPQPKIAFALALAETSEAARALPAVGHALRRARNAFALGLSTLTSVLSSPRLLRLVGHQLAAASDPTRPSWGRFLANLSRLAIARRARRRPDRAFALLTRLADDGTLTLVSVPAAASSSPRGPAPAAPEIVPAAVVWDHRAMGNDLVVRCLGVPLRIPFGGTGTYEFDCAPWLAATAPAAWHAALRPLLPASGERGRGAGGSTQHG